MTTTIKHTYSARFKSISSSSISANKRKGHDDDEADMENTPPLRRKKQRLLSSIPKSKQPGTIPSRMGCVQQQKTLTQLHFTLESSVLRTCSLCGLSYTRGAPDDEALHRSHCGRVQRGMEWGKEEEKESLKAGVTEVATSVRLKNGTCGRIICFPAKVGGKIGSKFANLLETINLTLASPSLTNSVLDCSKAYLFLVPSQTSTHREKIVGCVIAQRISTAMAVASPVETGTACPVTSMDDHSGAGVHESLRASIVLNPKAILARRPSTQQRHIPLVAVDTSSGLFCYPEALPTPLGIPRLFVTSAHRRQGIATHLLNAAAKTFIHGCPLDPLNGGVAFTQPTSGGNAVMQSWGKGFVRIYQE
ncbi:hypothetical protein V8B97DRAFT_1868402 [Scleroderma yunnanense]